MDPLTVPSDRIPGKNQALTPSQGGNRQHNC